MDKTELIWTGMKYSVIRASTDLSTYDTCRPVSTAK